MRVCSDVFEKHKGGQCGWSGVRGEGREGKENSNFMPALRSQFKASGFAGSKREVFSRFWADEGPELTDLCFNKVFWLPC